MDIGKALKRERTRRNLTQEQVAEILHITRPAYTMYETGQNIPSIETLIILADYYKTSLDVLTGRYIIVNNN